MQELTAYSNLNKDFQVALQDQKIANCDNEALSQALRYAMLLVGIRANNLPNQMEFDVLKNFIRRFYSGHTPAEIRLAFDKAILGELNLKPDEVKCFENFSCEYVSRIVNAYRVWAANHYNEQKGIAPDPSKSMIGEQKVNPASIVDYYYQEYLSGQLKIEFVSERVYDNAKAHFNIELSEDQLKSFVLRARQIVLSNYLERIKSIDANKKLGEYLSIKKANEALKAMDPLDSCKDILVNRQAKGLALIHFFLTQKEKGVTTLNP